MPTPEPVPDSPDDNEPDTIATPEGDNEAPPDAPLTPVLEGLETPRGSKPDAYRAPGS